MGRLPVPGMPALLATIVLVMGVGEALAHAGERAHLQILPTGYYLVGGAAAVALSFLLLALVPPQPLDRLLSWRSATIRLPHWPRLLGSSLAMLALAFLIAAGFLGSRDPLSNPLPLAVWTLFWVGFVLLQGVLGDAWRWINPLYAPWRLAAWMRRSDRPFVQLPARLGYLAAILQFLGFAWFELVYPSPDDPARLATVMTVYVLGNLAACILFGFGEWTRRGEPLSAFLGMIARMGILRAERMVTAVRVGLCVPGSKLADAPALPPSGAAFLLLALSTVSFDGMMLTFFWLGLIGVNPLEFPGRSAVMLENTLGLLAFFGILSLAFFAAVWSGERLAGARGSRVEVAGRLVWSIIPIALVYHFAHYLGALLVDGQYALAALSDPLMRGWDVFGTAGMHVQAGVMLGARATWFFWNVQAGAIVLGHLVAIAVAHVIAFRLHGEARTVARSQLFLACLMVFYTWFGLWLLASPTAG